MDITRILKAPLKGEFTNKKLKMKESIIINCILALIFAIAFLISAKSLTGDSAISYFSIGSMIDNIIDKMLMRVFILILINFVAIVFVFSGIIYMISKLIFNLELSYEECLSTCTYANIIPTYIMLVGVFFSLFSMSLSIIIAIIQLSVSIILTYESFCSLFSTGKSKLIYSISISYIVNAVFFAITNAFILKSMIESSIRNLFN